MGSGLHALVLAALVTPGLLWAGAALASVPIIIHLLSRRRMRRIRWAAMAWLLAAMKRNQRRLKLENWLILALRVAAIVLLGLALSRPILSDSPLAGLTGTKASVYLVLDNSLSTEAKLDARSVLERVKHEADLVLSSLGNDDSLAVIVTNDPSEESSSGLAPSVLVARSVGDEHALRARESVALLRARHAPASWPRALQLLQEQMRDEDVNRQVIVITDLQARDWVPPSGEAQEGTAAPNVGAPADLLRERLVAVLRRPARVRVLDVGGADRRNLAVSNVEIRSEREPFVGRPLELSVTVANFGREPVSGAVVELEVGGRPGRMSVVVPDLDAADDVLRVPRPGTQTVRATLPRDTFPRAGSYWVRARVRPSREDAGADALGLDSERFLALRVRDRIQVVGWAETSQLEVESGQREAADLYLRALFASDPVERAGATDALAPLYSYRGARSESELKGILLARDRFPVDVVVLANVEPREEATVELLRQLVQSGGGLLAFVGDRIRHPDSWNNVFRDPKAEIPLMPLAMEPPQVRERGRGDQGDAFLLDLSARERPHPLAAPFTDAQAADWIQRFPPQIWGRMPFREPDPQPAPGQEGPGEGAGGPPEGTQIVLRFQPEPGESLGRPAVVEGHLGEGRTLWVATSIDNGWLSRAGYLFLPVFLEESAMYLTKPSVAGLNMEVGSTLMADLATDSTDVRFAVPGGRHVSPTLQEESAEGRRSRYLLKDAGVAGVWELSWRTLDSQGEERAPSLHYAVNVDPGEAGLLAARRENIGEGIPEGLELEFLDSYEDAGAEVVKARESEISRELLLIVLALLLLESLLAMRFGRRSQLTEGPGGSA